MPPGRLWLQSMTPQAIRDGFGALRTDKQMQPLADAARCRSEADWLVGINGTRAMTAFNSRDGGFFLTTVGRVQTPTLSVVVEREEQIRKFISRDYWEIHASFKAQAGEYPAKWFDPKWKKDVDDGEKRADRVWTQREAQAIADAVRGVSEFFDWVKLRSAVTRGVTFGTMLKDDALHFIRLGGLLERGDNTARILDMQYHILRQNDDEGASDFYRWGALLRSLSAFQVYRKVYRDAITPGRVAELLILRMDMPRSLHACADGIVRMLQLIANGASA